MILPGLMWLAWKERNSRTFKDMERYLDQLKTLFTPPLFNWSHIWGFTHCSILEFPVSLRFSF